MSLTDWCAGDDEKQYLETAWWKDKKTPLLLYTEVKIRERKSFLLGFKKRPDELRYTSQVYSFSTAQLYLIVN